MLYLKVLIFAGFIPSLVLGIYLYKKKLLPLKTITISTFIFAAAIIPIDMYVVKKGLWVYDQQYLIGPWFLGLPFEEYLFYVSVIPLVMLLFLVVQHFTKK